MSDWPEYETRKRVRAKQIVWFETNEEAQRYAAVLRSEGDEKETFIPTEPAMLARVEVGDYAITYPDGFKSVNTKANFEATAVPVVDDATPRLITHNDVVGWMAHYAVRQHPYGRPDGLFDVTDLLTVAAREWPDGATGLSMWRVSGWREIERWLAKVLTDHPVLIAWNTPRSGHTQEIVATSRYWTTPPIDDFIDIGALLRNVALATWRRADD